MRLNEIKITSQHIVANIMWHTACFELPCLFFPINPYAVSTYNFETPLSHTPRDALTFKTCNISISISRTKVMLTIIISCIKMLLICAQKGNNHIGLNDNRSIKVVSVYCVRTSLDFYLPNIIERLSIPRRNDCRLS